MKKIFVVLALVATMGIGLGMPENSYAEGVISQDVAKDCEKSIFGMKPWYAGLVTKDNTERCVVGTPAKNKEAAFTWTVVLNVLFDLFAVLGLVSTGFIILGGYWYLRSGGDPMFVARGKKTIQTAVVGTVIALLSTLVTNLITTILTSS